MGVWCEKPATCSQRPAGGKITSCREDAGSTLNRRSALQPLPWELKFRRNALNHEPAF